jgi:methylmalonyl-CoA carboxyltransferase large subunit
MEQVSLKTLSEQIEALQRQIEALTGRLAQIEGYGAQPAPPPAATPGTAIPTPAEEGITEELLMAIAAAVSAYLGKRAPIRQIRLVSSQTWAQQGRAYIQASHRIDRKQD